MLRILVVEDDKYLNKLLCDRLLIKGLEVHSCLDGESALEELQSADAYDCLLIDMLLPRMMGAELLSRINENPNFQKLRKIAISGVYRDPSQIKEISQLHDLESYWTKPFDLDRLIGSILKIDESELPNRLPSGSLHIRPIERVHFEAYESGFTGRLLIRNQDQERRVYFLNGHPVAADSNAISESFGSFLVSSGQITDEIREETSRKMVEDKSLFGETLIKLGHVDKNRLFALLRKHTYQLLLNSFLSRQGDFEFEEMAQIPAHLPRIEFNPFLLMLAAQTRLISLKALDSLLEIKSDHFPEMESRVGQLLPLLNLKPKVLEFFQTLHPSQSVLSSLKKMGDVERESCLRVLYLFESIQLLRWAKTEDSRESKMDVPRMDFSPLLGEERSAESHEMEQSISAEYMDTLNKNYFEILGVTEDADDQALEEAYRSLRFQKHPDRYGPLSGQAKRILDDILMRLDQAYQTLSDPDQRKDYLDTIHRMSASSVADSKRYLEALDFQRAGKKYLDEGRFEEAKTQFEKAYDTWKSGVEYKAYTLFSSFKIAQKKNDRPEMSRVLHQLRELAYNHLQSEVCFILLGHSYKSSDQRDAAREAYRKALELNVNSTEAENSLAALADKPSSHGVWQKEINVSTQSAFKGVGYFVGFLCALVLAYVASQKKSVDSEITNLSVESIRTILPANEIRHKRDTTKVYLEEGTLAQMPDAVLKSKCAQSFEKLRLYGSMKLHLFEGEQGKAKLKAMCTDETLLRY